MVLEFSRCQGMGMEVSQSLAQYTRLEASRIECIRYLRSVVNTGEISWLYEEVESNVSGLILLCWWEENARGWISKVDNDD